jgi:hypothetical protein
MNMLPFVILAAVIVVVALWREYRTPWIDSVCDWWNRYPREDAACRFNHVLSLGLEYTDAATITLLCAWATVILVPEDRLRDCVPEPHRGKVRVLPIGEDRWGGWQRPDLISLIEQCL